MSERCFILIEKKQKWGKESVIDRWSGADRCIHENKLQVLHSFTLSYISHNALHTSTQWRSGVWVGQEAGWWWRHFLFAGTALPHHAAGFSSTMIFWVSNIFPMETCGETSVSENWKWNFLFCEDIVRLQRVVLRVTRHTNCCFQHFLHGNTLSGVPQGSTLGPLLFLHSEKKHETTSGWISVKSVTNIQHLQWVYMKETPDVWLKEESMRTNFSSWSTLSEDV